MVRRHLGGHGRAGSLRTAKMLHGLERREMHQMQRLAGLGDEIDVASEFRYREAPMRPGGLAIFISQSGETADTLATLRYARENKQHVLSVVNVQTSTIARESDVVMPTLAGPEIGVASSKAFTCQLAVLACLAIAAGRARGVLSEADERKLVRTLREVPGLMAEALASAAGLPAAAVRRAATFAGGIAPVARAALEGGAAGLERRVLLRSLTRSGSITRRPALSLSPWTTAAPVTANHCGFSLRMWL